jgi:hypothetical protein
MQLRCTPCCALHPICKTLYNWRSRGSKGTEFCTFGYAGGVYKFVIWLLLTMTLCTYRQPPFTPIATGCISIVVCSQTTSWTRIYPIPSHRTSELNAITPVDVLHWMYIKTFGIPDPPIDANPVSARSSSLNFFKKPFRFSC